MEKPLLSICIPTYNRHNFVIKTLDSITKQITDNYFNNIEIVVVDDGSKDNTENVIKEYQRSHPHNIKYFKNDKNLGFDKNLINTISLASGKYCWFIGDDDLLYPGAINVVMRKLNKNEDKFLLLNYSRMNTDTKEIVIKKMINLDSRVDKDINEFFFLRTPDSKFSILGMNLIYMSALVFKREHWIKYSGDYNKYHGINFIHSFIFLSIIAREKTPVTFISEPLVKYRAGNARDWGTNIWLDYHLKLLKEARKLDLDKQKINKLQFLFILKHIKSTYLGPIKRYLVTLFKTK